MTVKQEAAIFGTVVAAILTAILGFFLKGLSREWPLAPFLELCVIGCLGCLLTAWLLDKRSAARKADE